MKLLGKKKDNTGNIRQIGILFQKKSSTMRRTMFSIYFRKINRGFKNNSKVIGLY